MRSSRLIPGTILVVIGTLYLLDNFGFIDFNFWSLLALWPIFLIMCGVNLVFAHNKSEWATITKLAVLALGLSILIYGGLTRRDIAWMNWTYHNNRNYNDNFDDDWDSSDTTGGRRDSIIKIDGNSVFHESFKPGTQVAQLNITGGAATYVLKGTTSDLFEAATKEYGNRYRLRTHSDSTSTTLDFDMRNRKHGFVFNFGNKRGNRADIKLNTAPEWNIDLEAGAAKADFDLSAFKVHNLTVQGGAASFDVRMGQPLAETKLEFQTGAASVKVSIPQNAACRITTDTGLSSKNFNGFNKTSDDTYETPGFATATNKMYISMEGGVSDFKVTRY